MAGYIRKTALSPAQVLTTAEQVLPQRIGIAPAKRTGHGATYTGAEGTVTLSAHRHGVYTEVSAMTDRVRTSRVDYEIQKFLNELPYEPYDKGGPGSGEPS